MLSGLLASHPSSSQLSGVAFSPVVDVKKREMTICCSSAGAASPLLLAKNDAIATLSCLLRNWELEYGFAVETFTELWLLTPILDDCSVDCNVEVTLDRCLVVDGEIEKRSSFLRCLSDDVSYTVPQLCDLRLRRIWNGKRPFC